MKKIVFLGDSITDAGHCFSKNPLGDGYEKVTVDGIHLGECGNYIAAKMWEKAFEKLT